MWTSYPPRSAYVAQADARGNMPAFNPFTTTPSKTLNSKMRSNIKLRLRDPRYSSDAAAISEQYFPN